MDSEKGKTKRTLLTEEEKRERKNARQKEYDKETGYAAQIKYQKEKMKPYTIRISTVTEQDIIDQLMLRFLIFCFSGVRNTVKSAEILFLEQIT